MKYFLIGFIIWLAIAWLVPQARVWRVEYNLRKKLKECPKQDRWLYEV